MWYVSEDAVKQCVNQEDVTSAIETAFKALAREEAINFPIVRERLNYADAIFGFKSGFDRSGPVLGVKAGGLWPGNRAKGIANHQSTIVLFDAETGSPHALVRGTYLTALRTAAASALSIRHLSRKTSKTLGILGAGGQAEYQIRAALSEREFENILIADLSNEAAEHLSKRLEGDGLAASAVSSREMVEGSDVVITVTPSFDPIVQNDWVKDGLHIACMGADTKGKQELDASIMGRANVYCDEPSQAVELGELQHAFREKVIEEQNIKTLGLVLMEKDPGRKSEAEITAFDSTGMGLQDLAAATLALRLAREHGVATELPD
ncbi:MAG: ornithine cyclodeaminase family protein [Pseudomonadota bacterium]